MWESHDEPQLLFENVTHYRGKRKQDARMPNNKYIVLLPPSDDQVSLSWEITVASFLCILRATITVQTRREFYKSDFDFAFSHWLDLVLESEHLYLSLPLPDQVILHHMDVPSFLSPVFCFCDDKYFAIINDAAKHISKTILRAHVSKILETGFVSHRE